MNSKIVKDGMLINDSLSSNKIHRSNLWARTRVIGGYGLHTDEHGISTLGEVVFDTENLVPLGGVQYAMEMIFGIGGKKENVETEKKIIVPTLNEAEIKGCGAQSVIEGKEVEGLTDPEGKKITMPYPYGQRVCLFGIGCDGASENNLTAIEVKYNETNVSGMIPFRYTNDALNETDVRKYFGKKKEDDTIAYYLKRFDSEPKIYHFYKNGVEGQDGTEVTQDIWTSITDIGIESFTECQLTISKKDVREWFEAHGEIENARVNSIGLFSAIYNVEEEDYSNIQLFSKLNIPTEPLSLMKDMQIIYRVYGA